MYVFTALGMLRSLITECLLVLYQGLSFLGLHPVNEVAQAQVHFREVRRNFLKINLEARRDSYGVGDEPEKNRARTCG